MEHDQEGQRWRQLRPMAGAEARHLPLVKVTGAEAWRTSDTGMRVNTLKTITHASASMKRPAGS